MNSNKVLIWLKEFRYSWLPHAMPDRTDLIGLINNKIHELEQLLLTENNQNENEILIENDQQCMKSNDQEQIVLSTEQRSLPTPPDIMHCQIDDEHEKKEPSYRPIIRIKRISLDEAEPFLPPGWKMKKSKRKSKRKTITKFSNRKRSKQNNQTNKTLPSSSVQDQSLNNSIAIRKSPRVKKPVQPPSTNSVTNTSPINNNNNNKTKNKRKLRAITGEDDDLYILGHHPHSEILNGIDNDCETIPRFIGQNGILSQSRRQNETSFIDDNDFTIKLHSRQSNPIEKQKSIDYPTVPTEPISLDGDVNPVNSDEEDEILQNIIESNDNESLFASLDIPLPPSHEKPIETNHHQNNNSTLSYNDGIEDITNDGIDPPPSTSSPNINFMSLIT